MAYLDIAAYKDFLASEMVTLCKTLEEKLEKIATQRLLANYTNSLEAWAIVRDTR